VDAEVIRQYEKRDQEIKRLQSIVVDGRERIANMDQEINRISVSLQSFGHVFGPSRILNFRFWPYRLIG
jgi:hypothetical protein